MEEGCGHRGEEGVAREHCKEGGEGLRLKGTEGHTPNRGYVEEREGTRGREGRRGRSREYWQVAIKGRKW